MPNGNRNAAKRNFLLDNPYTMTICSVRISCTDCRQTIRRVQITDAKHGRVKHGVWMACGKKVLLIFEDSDHSAEICRNRTQCTDDLWQPCTTDPYGTEHQCRNISR